MHSADPRAARIRTDALMPVKRDAARRSARLYSALALPSANHDKSEPIFGVDLEGSGGRRHAGERLTDR